MQHPYRTSILMSVLLLACATLAHATLPPPGWDTNPYYTYQTWTFDTSLPAEANPGYISPGIPTMAIRAGAYWDDGMARIDGPTASDPFVDPMMTMFIPNDPQPDLFKEIWVDTVIHTNFDLSQLAVLAVIDDTQYPANLDSYQLVPLTTGVVQITALLSFPYQPPYETVIFTLLELPPNTFAAVDYVTVATRCIPEPITLTLLALGTATLIRKRG